MTVTVNNSVRRTATATATTVSTAYATATTITASGMRYRKYTHAFNALSANSGFTANFFKGKTPDFDGVTTGSLTFSSGSGNNLTLPGRPSFDASQAAILFQGFFLAPLSGTYMMRTGGNDIDNWGYLWMGPNTAYDWNNDNPDYTSTRTGTGPFTDGYGAFAARAGDAIPLTWLFANGGGPAASFIEFTYPGGSKNTDTRGLFVQPCSPSVFP